MGAVIVFTVTMTMFFVLLVYSLCRTSGHSDKEMERILKMGEYQKAYDEYRRKFARDRKITIHEATEYQAVKNYKEYLKKEYGAVITESGCAE